MTRLQHTLLALVALGPLWLPLASAADPAPPGGGAPASAHEIVEQRWPDGTLRERRQVLRLADGSVVGDGPFERWFPDGTKEYEARFVRGRKDGTTIRWHRNGQVASRDAYRDGERHGASVRWNDRGERVKEEHWADGRPHGTWTIWEDGKVAWTHTFDRGDPDP